MGTPRPGTTSELRAVHTIASLRIPRSAISRIWRPRFEVVTGGQPQRLRYYRSRLISRSIAFWHASLELKGPMTAT